MIMMSVKHYCDHCGKELNPMNDYIDITIDIGSIWRNHDLYEECQEELKSIIDNFCKGGAE